MKIKIIKALLSSPLAYGFSLREWRTVAQLLGFAEGWGDIWYGKLHTESYPDPHLNSTHSQH